MGVLHDRMATDLRLRGMSPVTQRMYLRCARALAAYHHRSPAALGEPEVRAFLDHLVRDRRLSRGTLRVYGAALRFLYRVTLERPDVVQRVPASRGHGGGRGPGQRLILAAPSTFRGCPAYGLRPHECSPDPLYNSSV